jgi:hypothetical protein
MMNGAVGQRWVRQRRDHEADGLDDEDAMVVYEEMECQTLGGEQEGSASPRWSGSQESAAAAAGLALNDDRDPSNQQKHHEKQQQEYQSLETTGFMPRRVRRKRRLEWRKNLEASTTEEGQPEIDETGVRDLLSTMADGATEDAFWSLQSLLARQDSEEHLGSQHPRQACGGYTDHERGENATTATCDEEHGSDREEEDSLGMEKRTTHPDVEGPAQHKRELEPHSTDLPVQCLHPSPPDFDMFVHNDNGDDDSYEANFGGDDENLPWHSTTTLRVRDRNNIMTTGRNVGTSSDTQKMRKKNKRRNSTNSCFRKENDSRILNTSPGVCKTARPFNSHFERSILRQAGSRQLHDVGNGNTLEAEPSLSHSATTNLENVKSSIVGVR